RYREAGTTWWGHFGKGNGEVDLPLTLEKIIVERRTHAMYVNDPQPARAEDVLLGDLNAEYARPEDRTEEVVRLDRVRMPVPAGKSSDCARTRTFIFSRPTPTRTASHRSHRADSKSG